MILILGLLQITAEATAQPAQAAQAPRAAVQAPRAVEQVTFDEAVRRAIAGNPSVAVAVAQLRRSEALLREARAGLYPTAALNISYVRLDNDRTLNGNVILAANQLAITGVVNVPLFVGPQWGRRWQAEDERNVTQAAGLDVRRTVAVGTARAYLTTLLAHRSIDTSLRALKNAQDHLDFARKRRQSGYGNRIDEVRAEQEMVQSELQLEAVYAQLVRAREALGVLCGGQGPLDVVVNAPRLQVPADLPGLLQEARLERADLRLMRARVTSSLHLRKQLWTYYTPSLVAVLQPFVQDPPTLTLPIVGFQGMLTLSIPIFDASRYGLRDEREAQLAEARASLDGGVRQAESEVRAAFEVQERNARSLERAREGTRLAAQALELANLAYRAGAATNLEVIDAERRARDADTSVVLAEDALEQARLDLLVAAGQFPAAVR